MPDRQQTVTTPCGTAINFDAGTLYRAVIVDNDATQYVYLPGVNRYIAPGQHGIVVPLVGTQVAAAQWQAPPGTVQNAVATGQATFTFTTADLPGSAPSFSQSQPYAQFPLNSGGTATSAGTTTTIGPLTLPSGSQSVLVVWKQVTGTSNPSSVTVTDSTGNITWGSITIGSQLGTLSDTVLTVPVATTIDGQILVKVTEPAATTHQVYAIAMPTPLATASQITGSDAVLPVTSAQQQIVVGTFSAGNGTNNSGALTLPSGTQAVMVVWTLPAADAPTTVTLIQVTDAANSNLRYGRFGSIGSGFATGYQTALFQAAPGVSPTVNVEFDKSLGSANSTVTVIALVQQTSVIATLGGSSINLPDNIVATSGQNLPVFNSSGATQDSVRGVVPTTLWPNGRLRIVAFGASPVAGTPGAIISAPGGSTTVILMNMTFSSSVGGSQAWDFQDTTGITVHQSRGDTVVTGQYVNFGGIPLTVGAGFQVAAETATSINLRGSVTFYEFS